MIVLDGLDTSNGTVRVCDRDEATPSAKEVREIERQLHPVGLEVVVDEAVVDDAGSIEHTWRAEGSLLVYEASLPHVWESAAVLGTYLQAALATMTQAPAPTLRAVRLAAYETAVNALEHGTLPPDASPSPRIRIKIELDEHAVTVTFEDECDPFDPTEVERPEVQAHALTKASRGYGITMVRALVDEMRYDRIEDRNRVQFRKGIR